MKKVNLEQLRYLNEISNELYDHALSFQEKHGICFDQSSPIDEKLYITWLLRIKKEKSYTWDGKTIRHFVACMLQINESEL